MGLASIKIDQTGLSGGVAGRARTDGLATGAVVTLTDTTATGGDTTEFRILWTPLGDTSAIPSLSPILAHAWQFTPSPGCYGEFLIELIRNGGTPTEQRERRVFGIRFPASRLLPPSLNQVADNAASITQTAASIDASDDNALDYPASVLNAIRNSGWLRKLYELFWLADRLAPLDSMAALRLVWPVDSATRHTLSYAVFGDDGGGQWLGSTGEPPGTYVHNGGTIIVPTTGPSSDGSGAWLRVGDFAEVDSRWFGFAPDASAANAASNGVAWAAIAAASTALGLPIVVPTTGTHYTTNGADITHGIRGVAGALTVIRASGAGFPYLLKVTGARLQVQDLFIHSDLIATDGIVVDSAAGTKFARVYAYYARHNGIVVLPTGNSIGCEYEDCVFALNGYTYGTGTATAAQGATTVPIFGAMDLTTLDLLSGGEHFVYFQDEIDASSPDTKPAYLHEIISIGPAQLEVYPPVEVALTASAYTIMAGAGHRTRAFNANGSAEFRNCTHISNYGPGYVDRGLFGARHNNSILESNTGTGFVIGASPAASTPVRVVSPYASGTFSEAHSVSDGQYAYAYRPTWLPGAGAFAARLTFRAHPGSDGPALVESLTRLWIESGTLHSVLPENAIGRCTEFTGAAPCTAILVPSAQRIFAPGTTLEFFQRGDGPVRMVGDSGVTVNFRDHRDTSSGPGSRWWARNVSANEWDVWGEGDSLGPHIELMPELAGWWVAEESSLSTGISEILDRGPGGHHMVQATSGSQPSLSRFRGGFAMQGASSKFIQASSWGTIATPSLYIFGEWDSSGACACDGDGSTAARIVLGESSGRPAIYDGVGWVPIAAGSVPDGTPFIARIRGNATPALSTLHVTTASGVVGGVVALAQASLSGLAFGALFVNSSNWTKKLTGALLFTSELSAADDAKVMAEIQREMRL